MNTTATTHPNHRRRRLTIAAVALAATLTFALPAQAVTVTAPCYTGGYFYTIGTAVNWQRHTHDAIQHDFLYSGKDSRSRAWGWHTGTQSGTVIGYQLSSADAVCPN